MSEKKTLSKKDWIITGLECLAEQGIENVKVERMAILLGVTKGSFYWHFAGREAFLRKMIDYWEKLQRKFISRLDKNNSESPEEQLRSVFNFISTKDDRYDIAVRMWAKNEKWVKDAVKRIDKERLLFLSKIFGNMGCENYEAELRARLVYYYQIAEQSLDNKEINLNTKQIEIFYNLLIR